MSQTQDLYRKPLKLPCKKKIYVFQRIINFVITILLHYLKQDLERPLRILTLPIPQALKPYVAFIKCSINCFQHTPFLKMFSLCWLNHSVTDMHIFNHNYKPTANPSSPSQTTPVIYWHLPWAGEGWRCFDLQAIIDSQAFPCCAWAKMASPNGTLGTD